MDPTDSEVLLPSQDQFLKHKQLLGNLVAHSTALSD